MRRAGHVVCMRDKRNGYRILLRKSEEKSQLGRTRCRWVDNIKMDLQEVEWGMDWIDLAQDRNRWCALVNAVMKRAP